MKTLATTFVLACACLVALGQGQVQFRNNYAFSTPPVNAPVTICYMGGPLDGSNPLWRAALIGGPTTATPASRQTPGTLSMLYNPLTTTLTWVNFRSAENAGYVTVASAARVVPGVNWGRQAMVQMVVWQGSYTTWNDAYNAWQAGTPGVLIGFSNPLTLTLPTGPTDPNLTYLTGLQPFCLGGGPPPEYFHGSSGPSDMTVNAGDSILLQVAADAWPPPDSYQWYFNGNLIPGANSATLYLPGVRSVDAGQYYATMHHVLGTFTSRGATLTVHVPPSITLSPQSQTAVTGSDTKFGVGATGDAPLSYRWYFNGSVPLATGTSLKLTSLQPQNEGAYTVVVSNAWSAVTSAPAMLNVITPVPMAWAPGVVAHAQSDTILDLEFAPAFAPANNWQPLAEIAMGTNTSQVFIEWPPLPGSQRFYRAWQPAGVSQPPLLSMELIPAITLTNAIGSSVRIDGINQVGPTDAWFTLATVTVTPTSQIYFDLSAIGQPARLYRLTPLP